MPLASPTGFRQASDMPMTPYDTLSEDARSERLRALARKALVPYRLQEAQLSCLRSGKRALLKVSDPSGGRFALRLWPADRAADALDRELRWLTVLRRDAGLHVPEPILSASGEWIGRVAMAGIPGFRHVVLLRWVDGHFYDSQLSISRLEAVGELLGQLHEHGTSFASAQRWMDPVERPGPDRVEVPSIIRLSESLQDRSAWDGLPSAVKESGEQAMPQIVDAIDRVCNPAEQGMIHGAVHQEHYLFHEGDPGLIGFSACRIGHPIEDLASVCRHLTGRETYVELRDALLKGYTRSCQANDITPADVEPVAAAQLLATPVPVSSSGTRAHQAALAQHLKNTVAAMGHS